MLVVMLCAALAVAVWFPQTMVGAVLKRLLIELPARTLNRVRRGHVLIGILVFAGLTAAHAIGKDEGVAAALQATAEGFSYFATFDLATYVDVVAIAALLAATVRFREAVGLAAAQARRWAMRSAGVLGRNIARLARDRARRSRPTATRPRNGEDSDRPAPGFAFAFA